MRNGTRQTQQAGFPGPPPARQPPGSPPSLLLQSGRGRGGRAPRMSPLTGFLPLVAGGESALPAGPRPYLPGPRQTQPPTAMGLSAKRAAHLPARLPKRRSQLRRRGRGVTGVHGGHPSSTEPPPRPLRSAAGRRRPRANFAGGRGSDETNRAGGPGGREDRECVRTQAGLPHLPSAEPAALVA